MLIGAFPNIIKKYAPQNKFEKYSHHSGLQIKVSFVNTKRMDNRWLLINSMCIPRECFRAKTYAKVLFDYHIHLLWQMH